MVFFKLVRSFLKTRKGRNDNYSFGKVIYCSYGIRSVSWGRLNFNNIESGRKVITRYVKGKGKLVIRVNPNKFITKKPNEVRMGNGKGDFSNYVYNVKPGHVIYEIDHYDSSVVYRIFKLVSAKIPIKTVLFYRDFFNLLK